jgi:hypothetical protein
MRPVRKADNLTTFMCRLSWNLGTSNSWNPRGLSRPVMGLLYLLYNSAHIRGSFQKFCTLYIFSLKMSLFYKIHLQDFNVISIVLYHSGPTFGKVLHSCLNAFVIDASDYSDHLIRHLLDASEAFPTEWFLRNKSKSGGLRPPDFDLFRRNHSVGNASEAWRRCLMRWRE